MMPRRYSAALCRGLIEATPPTTTTRRPPSYSAALCRGLIEASRPGRAVTTSSSVFRGFMPRPH